MSTPTPPYVPLAYERQDPYASYPPAGRKEQRRRSGAGIIVGAGIVALVAGAAGGAVGYTAAKSVAPALTIASSAGGSTSAAATGSISAVAAAVQPAVVQLNVGDGESGGTGSGFVISDDGYIVTNNHVAGGGGDIEVTFSDGSTATGKLIGANPGYDIAVVKVDRTGLATVPLGESGALLVGDTVIAVGSPLGLQGTVTTGIVSALNRPVTAGGEGEQAYINAIQTDAAINPGNSGGPLLNERGEVIGMNTAIRADAQGIGFAIPSNTLQRIGDQLAAKGKAEHAYLGVQMTTLTPQVKQEINSNPNAGLQVSEEQGVLVVQVMSGSPADRAGMKSGDVVKRVNGQDVATAEALQNVVEASQVGNKLQVDLKRDGRDQSLSVQTGAYPVQQDSRQ